MERIITTAMLMVAAAFFGHAIGHDTGYINGRSEVYQAARDAGAGVPMRTHNAHVIWHRDRDLHNQWRWLDGCGEGSEVK